MSLSVTLYRKRLISYDGGKTHTEDQEETYWANTTHNLGTMAANAGIYEALWRPYMLNKKFRDFGSDHAGEDEFEEDNPAKASEIIPLLEKGLADLKARPEFFEQFNASNGWGLYEHFVPFVEKYLEACKENPDAFIYCSR